MVLFYRLFCVSHGHGTALISLCLFCAAQLNIETINTKKTPILKSFLLTLKILAYIRYYTLNILVNTSFCPFGNSDCFFSAYFITSENWGSGEEVYGGLVIIKISD